MISKTQLPENIIASVDDGPYAPTHELAPLGWEDNTCFYRPDDALSITCVDFYQEEDITSPCRGEETFSISLILEGRGSFNVDGGEPCLVKTGMATLFSSDRVVSGTNMVCGGERIRLVDLRYSKQFLRRVGGHQLERFSGHLLNKHSVPECGAYLTTLQMTLALIRIGNDIMSCDMKEGSARNLYLTSKAIEVLAHVIDYSQKTDRSIAIIKPGDQDKLEQARQLLEQQYERRWTISILAKEVGLNESKLKACFKQIVGETIHTYLSNVRLEAAAQMLLEGTSVTETAYATGFSSLSHFSKVFREKTGCLPRDYARQS
jgi:AraC-like DNA-binding protein